MSKLKKLFSNWKIWVYLIFFVFTLFAINFQPFAKGVAIRTVSQNSTAYIAGIASPNPADTPTTRERIVAINKIPVNSVLEYENLLDTLLEDSTITITPEKAKYGMFSDEKNYLVNFDTKENLGLSVYDAPKSNILLGLDLQGGTRVVLQPEEKVSQEDMDIILENMKRI